jgi:multiple sugar transport system permease protein
MKARDFYQFITPSLIAMGVLMVFPLVVATWLGSYFMTYRNINNPQFVGVANYVGILTDPRFWQAVGFTVMYMAIVVPSTGVIGFVLALLLDQISRKLSGIFISAFLLPMLIVPVVGTLMFKLLFGPTGIGAWLFNALLNQQFIFSEASVKSLIIVQSILTTTPFPFIVLYAGLQTLPQEHLDAALMDGANRWQQIRYVVVPHLSSLFTFLGLILIMDAYRVFDSVFILTAMNPVYKADSVMAYTFRTATEVLQLGKANAMSIIIVIMILIILVPLLFRTYREQTEER